METKQGLIRNNIRALRITFPYGKTLYLSFILLVFSLLAFEIVVRTMVSFNIINTPKVGVNNPGFNIKLILLDKIIEDEGKIDCIFLGSSMVYDDIDPEVFSREYLSLSGNDITCFNFGVDYLTAESAGVISQLLVSRYDPSLLVFGTSARDYSLSMGGNRDIVKDKWIKYKLGSWSIEGALRDHSMVYRFYMQFLANLNPITREYIIKANSDTSVYGHRKKFKNIDFENDGFSINEKELQQKDFLGLRRVIKNSNDVREVLVVELPLHSNYMNIYVNKSEDSYLSLFITPVKKITANHGIVFIQTNSNHSYETYDYDWADMKHLNKGGSEKFSNWLAHEIWRLEQEGVLSWGQTTSGNNN